MRILSLSIFWFLASSLALAKPYNASFLQLPSNSNPALPLNATPEYLGDWPLPPFTVEIGDTQLIIERYGQSAPEQYRPVIVKALEMYRKYFLTHFGYLGTRPIFLQSGIVELMLNLSGRSRTKGEDVWAGLLPIYLYYSDERWSLLEIPDGRIIPSPLRYNAAVRFSITFKIPPEQKMRP